MFNPYDLMYLAIQRCREGIAANQSPFGCAIAIGNRLVACEHNIVLATTDITAHAEIQAIRIACHAVGKIFLEEAIVASTTEPCPMCIAALHWARVKTIYYGASIADAKKAGFNELQIPAADLLRLGQSDIQLVPDILADECRQLFAEWQANPQMEVY